MKNHAKLVLAPALLAGLFYGEFPPEARAEYVTDPAVESVVRGDQTYAFPAGYIRLNQPLDGVVNQVTGDNQVTGNRMISGGTHWFYLRMNASDDLKLGSLYTVYRRVHKAYHPVTRQYLGELIHQLGIVKIVQIEGPLAAAKLVASFNPIGPGDHLARFTPPETESSAGQTVAMSGSDMEGIVVDFLANRTLVGQRQVVYLDRGRNDGVKAGDVMQLYRTGGGLPRRMLGEVKVLAVEDRTATALVTKVVAPVLIGDRVSMKSSAMAQGAASADVDVLPMTEKEQVRRLAQRIDDLAKESQGHASVRTDDAGKAVVLSLDDLVDHLYFESGEAIVKAEGQSLLKEIGALLKDLPDKQIRVEGHADAQEIGPTLKSRFPSNWELSKARAAGIARYLVQEAGIDPDRVSTVGYGASKPVATNTTEDGRQKNRRVEIVFPTEDQSKAVAPKPAETTPSETPAASYTDQSLPTKPTANSNGTTLSTVATPSLTDGASAPTGYGAGSDPASAPTAGPDSAGPSDGAGAGAAGPSSQTDVPPSDSPLGDAKTSSLPAAPDAPADRGAF